VLEYERRFQDLTVFSSTYLPTERHRVERFRDGLRRELRMILIAMQFQAVRELVRAAQGMERVIKDTPKPVVKQSQAMGAKRRDFEFIIGRPPLPNKGKSGHHQDSSSEGVGVSPQEGAQEDLDKSVEEELGEDSLDRESKLLEGLQSKRDQYIRFVRGVSSDTRNIALRCRGDVIFVEVRGIDGKSARM